MKNMQNMKNLLFQGNKKATKKGRWDTIKERALYVASPY